MNVYSAIILCFIPFLTAFALFKILVDDISVIKELIACLVGLVALIPITIIQQLCGEFFIFKDQAFFSLLVRALILYGLIEEGIKCSTLFIIPKKNINAKQMFFYAMLAGLFLGCFESVVYLVNSIQKASSRGGEVLLFMIYVRTFTSIVIHTFCAGLSGLFVYSVFKKQPKWSALVYTVLIHGLYDFFWIMPKPMSLFSYVAILLLLAECRIVYVRVRDLD